MIELHGMGNDHHLKESPEGDTCEPALDLPSEVDDSEAFIRMIKSPYHLKKGKLKRSAFQPPKGQTVISVARRLIGASRCADQGRASLSNSGGDARYVGLAAGTVGRIRGEGFTVLDDPDSPGAYPGHAHIDYPPAAKLHITDSELLEPEDLRERARLLKFILESVEFYVDPEPDGEGWSGDEVLTPEEVKASSTPVAEPSTRATGD